ncbi:MAG: hypothetical protein COU31_00405 [Candidatus Magasanikbacteria bacterium CG10_big_fil_rev_8_21_14_0_10_40_10]|uniref:Uncharacterized protein n=1 Tax=Candidatus Magasanikbacteria bacterium CG10_big_fil_rev_8_21_14_0_10_40_10 TaxID=1974648 RepID=A0A2M6W555_9BACT|nr:MAG: hypothetical protein COU31_00405 [Candidatus Magasanikbacteria bacterium CG10_big_fil_rev_8_21_14_0_10_40_10]
MYSRRAKFTYLFLTGLFLIYLMVAVFFIKERAYSYNTNLSHPALAKMAVDLFNRQTNNTPLANRQIEWILNGSIAEDTPNRWLNHFYDPIHEVGLRGLYDSARVWAQDNHGQRSYALGDKTWQKAIADLRAGR